MMSRSQVDIHGVLLLPSEEFSTIASGTVQEIAVKSKAWVDANFSEANDEKADQCLKTFTAAIAYQRIAIDDAADVFISVYGDGATEALERQRKRWGRR